MTFLKTHNSISGVWEPVQRGARMFLADVRNNVTVTLLCKTHVFRRYDALHTVRQKINPLSVTGALKTLNDIEKFK